MTNKKGVIPALAILVILGGVVAGGVGIPVAVDKISGKDIGPDNAVYGIERAGEAIQLAFTGDHVARAQTHLAFASERVDELKAVADVGKPEFVEGLANDYNNEIAEVEREIEGAKAAGKDVTSVQDLVANMTAKHYETLEDILTRVPPVAVEYIEKAINVSWTGHNKASEALGRASQLPSVPAGKP
ncbi:MAG: hypothetical protein JSW41_02265 [Candidatus Aenigmatarchaeota archaeon]|nr:MAG: hypothetical protein JSW41_02265 [Candidatus Aenigmarchaeota archaeon]